jgi:hypothetical protein
LRAYLDDGRDYADTDQARCALKFGLFLRYVVRDIEPTTFAALLGALLVPEAPSSDDGS